MAKASSASRGYGAEHRAERARWEPKVEAGGVDCYKCGNPIVWDAQWDLGHTEDRSAWTGPEHPRCNREDGGKRGNAKARENAATTVRDWFAA